MYQNALRQLIEEPRKLIFWTFLLSALPFLHWFGILLMALVTLRKGWREGLMLAAVAILAGLILNIFILGASVDSMHSYVQSANVIGIWLLASMLHQSASWTKVLMLATILGVAVVGLIHLIQPNVVDIWVDMLTKATNGSSDAMPSFISKEVAPEQVKLYVSYLSQIMTGMQVLISLSFALLSLVVARYMQAALYNPGGLKPELYSWRLDTMSGSIFMLLLALAALTKQSILIDCVPVLLLPAACVGLSLVYYFSARSPYQIWLLLTFYVVFFLLFPQVLALLTTLGFLDIVVNFRQRFQSKG